MNTMNTVTPNPWILAARPRTLPISIMPVVLGSALAYHSDHFLIVPALVCLLFALLVQIGANYANDYYDFIKGADTPERKGPQRAVASGLVEPTAMRNATFVVLGLAFLLGLALIAYGGWWLIIIGALSVVCAIAYTGGPFPLGYHGLGDLFVFIFFGLVAVMVTYYVQVGHFTYESFLVGVGYGLMAVNVLVVTSYRDINTDRQVGKKTLAVRFGREFAQVQFSASLYVALGICFLLWVSTFRFWVLLPLLLLPYAYYLSNSLITALSTEDFKVLLFNTMRMLVLYGLILSLGIVLS
ncbi:MAG: 1,4-dihydroxy-2-naphthoate polyprenyltransferase [Opitutales bacterium]|tara:strand:+ start:1792 stop:2685 length:894 start_codon:yes stop_codon:yes gene_type:complete